MKTKIRTSVSFTDRCPLKFPEGGEMSGEIAALAQQLGAAVELTMNPAVPMEQRHQAFSQLEEFKEKSPYGSQCGFYLVESSTSPVVRHFGLKILEDVVKARWHSMVAEEKLFIKESLMKLMASGTGNILVEHLFIKVQNKSVNNSVNNLCGAGRVGPGGGGAGEAGVAPAVAQPPAGTRHSLSPGKEKKLKDSRSKKK